MPKISPRYPLRFKFSPSLLSAVLLLAAVGSPKAFADGARASDFTAHVQTDLGSGDDIPYRLYVPQDYDPTKEYPLMLWLHGWGERGTNNTSQLGGPFTAAIESFLSAENQVRHPCIVVAPQIPHNPGSWWDYQLEVEAILDRIELDYSVDTTRRYITGLSYGGMGTWAYLTNWQDYWAAGVPICGHAQWGGGYGKLDEIPNMPIWAFHSVNDPTVGVEGTDTAVMDHRKGGGNAFYTRYATAGHDAWTPAYETPQLVEWVMSQRLDESGTGVVHVDPLPYVSIDTARVGSTLSLEGRVREEGRGDGPELDLQVDTVYWWSSEIDYEQRAWDASINGRSIFSASASFTQADVGKRIVFGNNNLDRFNGYEITSVSNANTVGVAEWLGSFSSVYWELHSPGSRYNPIAVDGVENWTADEIPLSPGINRIHVVARAHSQSDDRGYAWLGGDTIEVEMPDPGPASHSLTLNLDSPVEPGVLLATTESTFSISGNVAGATGAVTVSWENNRGGSGSKSIDGAWTIPSIPVAKGYNRIRISAVDSTGAEEVHIIWLVGNVPPDAPPRQYLHAFPDSVQSISIDGDFEDSNSWPAVSAYLGGVNAAENGSVSYADGVVEYVPNPGFTGLDRFTYEVSDGFQHSEGVVTVSVGGALGSETTLLDLPFASASLPNDLVGTPPSGVFLVDDISAEADGGSWSINGGALRMERPGIGGNDIGAGFRKALPEAEAVVLKFDLRVSASYSGFWSDLIMIALGDFGTYGAYDDWIHGWRIADILKFGGQGDANMSINHGGIEPVWEDSTDGTPVSVIWFVNAAESARSWQGPNGVLFTVDPHASTLLVNGTVIRENLPRESNVFGEGLDDLVVFIRGNVAATIHFDHFSIIAVEEALASGVASWRQATGLAEDGSEDDSVAANGQPRLVNFAFGIDGTGSMRHSLLDVPSLPYMDSSEGGELCIVARDPDANPGIVYEVKWSPDLINWQYREILPEMEEVADGWVRMKWPMVAGEDASFYQVDVVPLD